MLTSLFPRRELFSPRPGSRHDLNAAAGSGWEHAAGIAGLVLTALASYGVLALELEGQAEVLYLPWTPAVGVGILACVPRESGRFQPIEPSKHCFLQC